MSGIGFMEFLKARRDLKPLTNFNNCYVVLKYSYLEKFKKLFIFECISNNIYSNYSYVCIFNYVKYIDDKLNKYFMQLNVVFQLLHLFFHSFITF